ncbi:jg367 [Pararge aegeria aegeria]|uniref:Jg367 protein n=2 Tax=Pararge aegeria TaxID=116150 RepID=A0A8S4QD42_9NEOP|nr:jg367 [Pararge aegeria aegeria]
MVVLCVLLAAFVSGQVTFSRDWSGGKRSPAAVFDCGQFARLCRHFLHELKQEMSDDKLIKHSRLEPEVQVNFEDDK